MWSWIFQKSGVTRYGWFQSNHNGFNQQKIFILQNHPSDKDGYGVDGSMFLKVNSEQDSSKLKRFELNVMNFLTQFEEDGVISMDAISDDLSNRESAKSFRETYMGWVDNIKNQFLNDNELNKFFNRKGDTYTKIFGGLGLAVSVIVFIFALMDSLPAADIALVMSIVLGVVAIISLILPRKNSRTVDNLRRRIRC